MMTPRITPACLRKKSPCIAGFAFALALGSVAPRVVAQTALATSETIPAFDRAVEADSATGEARNPALAAALYKEAAAEGNALAHFRLGYLNETGDGVPQDYFEARKHYEAAANAGMKEASLRLAICHLEGWGGPVDRAAFVRELRAAAEANYAPAQRILSSIYVLGFTVPEDRAEGIKWLERAAALNDTTSQLALGRNFEAARRLALSPDLSLARNWYQLSAEQEYRAGMLAMGRTFLVGPTSDRNWALGRHWLELAVETGDAEAPYILAITELLHPDTPHPEVNKARAWLDLASQRGNERATEVMQLEIAGQTLRDAMQYVLTVPFEDRYVQKAVLKAGDEPTRQPVIYRVVRPIYPQSLRLTATMGEVLVDFVVDNTGRVTNAKVIRATHPLFGVRALEAVQQWRFYPARKDGRLMNAHMQVPVKFLLKEETMGGVDALLLHARQRAETLGPVVAADASDLRAAITKDPLPALKMKDGSALPADAAVMILLVLDSSGRPLRGHVLEAQPEAMGVAVLASALAHTFQARVVDGEAVTSNCVLTYTTGRFLMKVRPKS